MKVENVSRKEVLERLVFCGGSGALCCLSLDWGGKKISHAELDTMPLLRPTDGAWKLSGALWVAKNFASVECTLLRGRADDRRCVAPAPEPPDYPRCRWRSQSRERN